MPQLDAPTAELLRRLYGGLDQAAPWQDFLEALADWMEADFATLILTAPGTGLPGTYITPGADPVHRDRYIERFFADDPFRDLPEGQATSFQQFMAGRPRETHAAYHAWLQDAGSEDVLGVDLRFRGFEARFRLTRGGEGNSFTPAERAAMQALVPHLRIAVGLYGRLEFAGAEARVFQSTAEGMGLALLIIDRDLAIVSTNPLAERLLATGEGVARRGGRLVLHDAAATKALAGLLAGGEPVRCRIARPGHGDLVMAARVLEVPAIRAGAGALALTFVHPGRDVAIDPAALRRLFGLTPAEAELAAVLADGATLVEAARIRGIAHNTAKAQLRAVFAKTGVHRQAQLVALLAATAR